MSVVNARTILSWTAAVAAMMVATMGMKPVNAEPPTYATNIKPIMTQYCVSCHSGQEAAGRLDLTTLDKIKRGGMSGPAIKSGKGDESALVRRMRGLDNKQIMPPGRAAKVPAEKIKLVSDWITQGAK
jgi:hypothetical protein